MRSPKHHILFTSFAALAIGLSPMWVPLASAEDVVPPDEVSTPADVADPATPPGDTDATDTPTSPADPADPADPTVPADDAADDPAADVPTDQPVDPPTTDKPDVPVTTEEGDDDHGGDDGHGGHGTLPEGVVVTVDGRDINAGDPAGSLPKIAGCSFEVSATGLATDPADTVGVKVIAWPPTVPEDGRVTLVDVTETSADGAWSGSFPLDEEVQQFTRKGNGYHMRFEVYINGAKGAMKMYWLGCGEPQTGNPRRMLFDADWFTANGKLLTGPMNDVLPAGWREEFAIQAASERGTATCTYEPGDDVLTCLYDNPGHADQPGLVLPGEPGTDYTVKVVGVPKGWDVDPVTIGTFLADETCPRTGHDDHGEEAYTATREGHDSEPCIHTVVLNGAEQQNPPDDEGGGGGANPPDNNTGDSASGNAAAGALPLTGATSLPLVPVALAMLAMGIAFVAASRRRRPVQIDR
jgi:hypothetical protein